MSKNCYLCYQNPLTAEWNNEQIKKCAEHWLDAENCPNYKHVKLYILPIPRRN